MTVGKALDDCWERFGLVAVCPFLCHKGRVFKWKIGGCDVFDLGWSELLIVGIVAVLVIGPKDLPVVLRSLGRWVSTIRHMAADFQMQFQQAVDESEVNDIAREIEKARQLDAQTMIDKFTEPDPVEKDIPQILPPHPSILASDPPIEALDAEQTAEKTAGRSEP